MRQSGEPAIHTLLQQRNWTGLRDALSHRPASEIADLLRELPKADRALVFRSLPRPLSARVFSKLEREEQNRLLTDLTDDETRQLLAGLKPDVRTQLLGELPGRATQRLLKLLGPEELTEARRLLGYPDESVGRLMTPEYVAVRPDWTIERALGHIREQGRDSETIDVIYVTDEAWKLLDALELRRFILADPAVAVETIMDRSFVSLAAFNDREQAVRVMQRHDLSAVPVVDSDGVLVGIVTVDDVLDVAEVETTEDFHKWGALAPLKMSYREAGIGSLYRKRIGWLAVLILVNLVSASVIAAYEETLSSAIALASFIPLLVDSAGNTGAQSATLMVRALATGDVQVTQWLRMVVKELGVGAALGLTLGLAAWPLGVFRGGFGIATVVAITMVSNVFVANSIGVVLPFLLTRFRIDPAVASGPLITSVADAAGLLIYFSVATLVLAHL